MTYSTLLTLSQQLPESLSSIKARVQLARLRSAMQDELEIYQSELQTIQQELDEPDQMPQDWPEPAQEDLEELLGTEIEQELPQLDQEHLDDEDALDTATLQLMIEEELLS